MKVRFIEVGRDKKTFEAEIDSITEQNLERALHQGASIRSRSVSFLLDGDSVASGIVAVGDMQRPIGRWEVKG